MTVLVNDTVERFTVSGVGPYAFNFRIFAATDLQVTACSTATPPVPTLLTYLSDYTVDGVNDADGGTILLVAGTATTYAGYTLDIRSATPNSQPTSIRNIGRFLPEVHEDALDNLDRQVQDLHRIVRSCIRYPDNVLNDGEMTPLAGWLSKYLTINSSGVLEAAALSSTAVTASVITTLLTGSTAEQDAILALLMERTDSSPALTTLKRIAAEVTLSITVINYAYVPGEVDRYVTNTTSGTTDTLAGWNAAGKLAKNTGCDLIYGRTWPYLTTGPVDLTCAAGADNFGFNVRCIGQAAAHTTNSPGYPSILANHTGHVFDCAGALAINWIRVSVGTLTAGSTPKTAWFLARNSAGSSQIHRFDKCRAIGKFSKAVIYNYGSENDQYDGCVFYNYATDAGAKVGLWTAANVLSLSSTFITIATGTRPTTAHYINGGVWIHGAGGATSDVWYLEGATSFNIDSPFTLCTDGAATRGRSLLYIDTTNGPTNLVHLKGIQSEYGSFTCQYGIYIGDAVATVAEWIIDGCNLSANTSKIASHANVVLDSFHMRGVNSSGGTGNISIAGTLQNSDIMEYSTNILIGTSKDNNLFVSIPNLTVTTRDGDKWYGPDQTLAAAYTPGTASVTHGGTLTISQKVVHHDGRMITVGFSISDSVSMSWAANAAITGLPVTCVQGRGMVTVVNVTTGATIGNGSVNGTSILLPALAAGGTNEIAINAVYVASA